MGRRLAIAVALLLTLVVPPLAYAASVTLYPGAGVGAARLNAVDTSAVSALKKSFVYSGRVVNHDYAQPVYQYRFGRALLNSQRKPTGHYPVEMYAYQSHRVFTFEINTSLCVTSKGIKVGSTEAQLKKAYGSSLKFMRGSIYLVYWSSSRTGGKINRTDYYVSKTTRKIVRVMISRY